jgi:predicted aspartyl protease
MLRVTSSFAVMLSEAKHLMRCATIFFMTMGWGSRMNPPTANHLRAAASRLRWYNRTRGEIMGTFFHTIRLIAASGAAETLDALVDTGAMFTTIPSPILERLGVRPFDSIPVRFANGHIATWRMGQVEVELDGRRRPILCLFGSPDAPPLIGAHTLEAFLLTVDPIEQKLVPKEAYLM